MDGSNQQRASESRPLSTLRSTQIQRPGRPGRPFERTIDILNDDLEDENDDDEDNESDDEQTNRENGAYDPESESLPKHAAFDPALPHIKTRHIVTLQKVIDAIKEHSPTNQDVRAMLERGEESVQEVQIRKKVFGFVGDTGMGKSATINSVTGIWPLAKADASGQSCTQVVTIYKHRLDFQSSTTSLFAAEIRYLSLDKCREFMSEQLNSYNRYTFRHVDDSQHWDAQQEEEYKHLCDQALNLFQTLFCDQEDFKSQRAAQESLQADYYDPYKPAIGRFLGWCEEHFACLDIVGDTAIRRYTAETLDDINAFLEPHVYQKEEVKEPALCALIEHVSIGAASSEILKHIDLVDLPGISDINSVRAGIAHREVSNCDGLLLFDTVKRCLTNPGLEKILRTYGEQFGAQLTVVITHSDETGGSDDVIAHAVKRDKQSVGDYFLMAQDIEKLESEIKMLTKRIRRRQLRLAAEYESTKSTALNIMKVEKSEKCEALQEIKNRKFGTLVDARNANIIRKMKRDKGRYMPARVELEVHCISNTHYQSLCDGNTVEGLQLNAMHTGIPALRAHLLMLTAPSKLRAVEELMGKATIFLSGVQMWVENTPNKQGSGLMEIITSPSQQWSSIIDEYLTSVATMFKTQITRTLRDERLTSLEGARGWISNTLETWHPNSILSFFAKNGNHSTLAIGSESWNERFLDVQTENVIRPRWPMVEEKQKELLTAGVEDINGMLKSIPYRLSQNPNAVTISSSTVKRLTTALTFSIHRSLETRLEESRAALSVIKTRATKDIPDAFFTVEMRSTYDQCNADHGHGKTRRMLAILKSDLRSSRVTAFHSMAEALERQFIESATVIARGLQSDVQTLLVQMRGQFQRVINKQIEAPQARAARRELGFTLKLVQPALAEISMDLRAIKEKYQ